MTDKAVILDRFRSPDAQRATTARRERLCHDPGEGTETRIADLTLTEFFSAPTAQSWDDAAEAAIYLLRLYSMTSDAKDPPLRHAIAQVIEDLARMSDGERPAE